MSFSNIIRNDKQIQRKSLEVWKREVGLRTVQNKDPDTYTENDIKDPQLIDAYEGFRDIKTRCLTTQATGFIY